ncbi:(Fe-S)-binding protein [Quatrionicoccus australiensis]|uniref:(Fe-S)-binding protein n=1 Tax=Quatrionicoccus australiensis TaxID=138118 RepID=UPI001CFAE677|nr:4Fe-4S dicluster domain-containing protein [Quatrionicoccus australiensis]MCB4360997.1 4Fe-4S dicluster domain-containing protein [Quatrionicoccus australiensis]
MKTHLDWSAYDTYGAGDAYAGIPATGGNYAKAVAVCMNNHQCQRDGKGVMCPSYRITHDPAHSTGARVKAFKAALNGELGDEPFSHPDLAAAMDLCVSCKGCKKECPSAVDMTLIKTEYLAQKNERHGVSLRARLFGSLPAWLHRWRAPLALLVRWRNASPWLAALAERRLGISARRPIPAIVGGPLPAAEAPASGQRGKVLLFVDTFTHYYTPEVASAARAVLTAAGYAVEMLRPAADDGEPERPLCCGRTYLSQGMVEAAKREGKRVMAALAPALAAGTPIIGLEPSCLLALRDEFYSLSLGPDVAQLGKQAFLFEEFLMREANKGMQLKLQPIPGGKALVHGHCHQKAFGAMKSVRKVLAWIPEFEFEIIDASCCGMSGSFGLEAEHYAASVAMGELALLPAVRAAAPDTLIVADGFSCRHQIADGSGRQAIHVAVLLQRALA